MGEPSGAWAVSRLSSEAGEAPGGGQIPTPLSQKHCTRGREPREPRAAGQTREALVAGLMMGFSASSSQSGFASCPSHLAFLWPEVNPFHLIWAKALCGPSGLLLGYAGGL